MNEARPITKEEAQEMQVDAEEVWNLYESGQAARVAQNVLNLLAERKHILDLLRGWDADQQDSFVLELPGERECEHCHENDYGSPRRKRFVHEPGCLVLETRQALGMKQP